MCRELLLPAFEEGSHAVSQGRQAILLLFRFSLVFVSLGKGQVFSEELFLFILQALLLALHLLLQQRLHFTGVRQSSYLPQQSVAVVQLSCHAAKSAFALLLAVLVGLSPIHFEIHFIGLMQARLLVPKCLLLLRGELPIILCPVPGFIAALMSVKSSVLTSPTCSMSSRPFLLRVWVFVLVAW